MGTILAHGAHPNAIRHDHASNLQWREELRNGGAILGLDGGARRRVLSRSEEGDALGADVDDGFLALLVLVKGGGFGS